MYYFYSHGIIVTLIFIAKYCLIDFFSVAGIYFYEEKLVKAFFFHKIYSFRLSAFYICDIFIEIPLSSDFFISVKLWKICYFI